MTRASLEANRKPGAKLHGRKNLSHLLMGSAYSCCLANGLSLRMTLRSELGDDAFIGMDTQGFEFDYGAFWRASRFSRASLFCGSSWRAR